MLYVYNRKNDKLYKYEKLNSVFEECEERIDLGDSSECMIVSCTIPDDIQEDHDNDAMHVKGMVKGFMEKAGMEKTSSGERNTGTSQMPLPIIPESLCPIFCRYISLVGQYYWDFELQLVVKLKTGSDNCSSNSFEIVNVNDAHAPRPNHQEKRNLNRQIKRERKKREERFDKIWQKIYDNSKAIEEWKHRFLLNEKQSDVKIGLPKRIGELLVENSELIKNNFGLNPIIYFIDWTIRKISKEIRFDKELREKCLKENAFLRERSITLESIFKLLMTAGGDNLALELNNFFGAVGNIPTSSALVQRRHLIKEEAFKFLFTRMQEISMVLCSNINTSSPFSDRFGSILALDGSDINIWKDETDESTHVGQDETRRKGWNQFHLNAMCDAISGFYMNAYIQPKKKTHETQAAIHMIREMNFTQRSLILGDRGYGCLNLLQTIILKPNLDCIIRVKEDWIKEIKALRLEELDTIIKLHIITTQSNEDKIRIKKGEAKLLSGKSKFGKYKKSQVWDYESEVDMEFRVVRFKLPGGNWETLVTTLSADNYTVDDLKELYHIRWKGIENAFRSLKYDNHLAIMHSKIRDFEKQEIYSRLTMYNVITCVIRIANARSEFNEAWACPKDKQAEYVINRHVATEIICYALKNIDNLSYDVIKEILRHKSIIRHGRSFKRDMKAVGFRSLLYR